jgi:hypothetical protein
MQNDAVDVGDGHDDELIIVYDNENLVIEVGILFQSMDEFRICFRTYAVNHEFETKTLWTDKNKFYAKCKCLIVVPCYASGIYLLDANMMEGQ